MSDRERHMYLAAGNGRVQEMLGLLDSGVDIQRTNSVGCVEEVLLLSNRTQRASAG